MTDLAPAGTAGIPLHVVAPGDLAEGVEAFGEPAVTWAKASGFLERRGVCVVPGEGGAKVTTVIVAADPADPFALASAVPHLPPADYAWSGAPDDAETAVLAWLLAGYRFTRYLTSKDDAPPVPRLVLPTGINEAHVRRLAAGVFLARDLVNTPANDMGPQEMEDAARTLAEQHDAAITVTSGADLERDFPMVHAVGRASPRAPRLIDLSWGDEAAPKVTLVGKGVAFDTGGLDIKPAAGMRNMKKDMGGAANALALAQMIMDAKLPVRLRVLVPAVENAIDGSAFRPGDVLRSRKGLTVEIGNTDAEGRLILADALALADEEAPELLVDLATLTGAARVALGPEVMPFYTADDAMAEAVAKAGAAVVDPVWRMPLWPGYDGWLASKVADLSHISAQPFAGSVTAALFLQRFVEKAGTWAHFDIFGWNATARPGRPEGGEAQGIRALYGYLEGRYGG